MAITGVRTPEDDAASMDRIEELLSAGERFALVVDDRALDNHAIRGQARRALQWAVSRWGQLKRTCVGLAIIVDELDLVTPARAHRRLRPILPVPVSIFTDAEMADAWLRSRLAAAGEGHEIVEQYAV
jgi:hypothetical protein